jgi:glycosyltransferase involved in cell wall biosynthesis
MYNKASRIEGTLRSVLRQTHQADEVIVVNDGSTDGSERIVRERFASSVRLIDQPNGGVSRARNTGLRAARNEFVCLLDSDDEWEPGYLAEMAMLVERFPRSQLFGIGFWVDDHGIRSTIDDGVPDDFVGELEFFGAYSRAFGFVSSSTVCIRKSNFDSGIVFPEGARHGEDIHYWFRLAQRGPMAFSARRLGIIHRDQGAASFRSRIGDVPHYLYWVIDELPSMRNRADRRHLCRILREHSLKSALLAVEAGDAAYLASLSGLLRPRHPMLALAVQALRAVPSRAVALARGLRQRRRRVRPAPRSP